MISYLQIDKLTKSFGDLVLFEDITFGVAQGQKIGLIAKNGTGKTTLLNIIGGKEDYDSGEVVFRKDLRVGYLEQSPSYPEELTVLQACFHSKNETVQLIAEYEEAMAKEDHSNLEDILTRMDSFKAWDYEQKAKQILGQLKIHNFNQKIGELSGGQLKRVALANVLITDPELIILDEPTNHLDLEMTEWLEDYLSRANISILMVTHDRYFLDRVCSEIIEIDNKQIYSYKGNYSYYLEKRQERVEAMNADVERAKNLLRTELDWMRRQPQARGTKAKYRIDAFYELEKKAKQQRDNGNVNLDVKASYIGSKIFEAEHVTKSFGSISMVDGIEVTVKSYTDESYRQQEKERESLIERQKEVKEQLEEEMAKTGEEYSKEKVIALTEENNEIGFPVPLDLSIFVYTFQYPLDKETAVSYESMYEKLKQEPMFEGAADVLEE